MGFVLLPPTPLSLLFMQGQKPIFALQAPSCSCMHFSHLPLPANKRKVTAAPFVPFGLPTSPTSASFHQLEPRYLIKQEFFCAWLSPDLGLK